MGPLARSSFTAKLRAVHAKYQRRFDRVIVDKNNRIVNASLSVTLNNNVLPALHTVPNGLFEALLRFDRWFNLHRSSGVGIKAYLPVQRPFVHVNVNSLPAYFKFDYVRSVVIARFRSRLRVNRARTNVYLHHVDSTIKPICPFCGQTDTMRHILVECVQFQTDRDFAEAAIFHSTGLLPLSLPLILGFVDHYDTGIQQAVLGYTHGFLSTVLEKRRRT
jgi:hypothetical protein